VKIRRCEDEKMRYRPPLLEEPCTQTLSGENEESEPVQVDDVEDDESGTSSFKAKTLNI
jgi:hypothetical protein